MTAEVTISLVTHSPPQLLRSAGGQEQPERAVVYTWRLKPGEN